MQLGYNKDEIKSKEIFAMAEGQANQETPKSKPKQGWRNVWKKLKELGTMPGSLDIRRDAGVSTVTPKPALPPDTENDKRELSIKAKRIAALDAFYGHRENELYAKRSGLQGAE